MQFDFKTEGMYEPFQMTTSTMPSILSTLVSNSMLIISNDAIFIVFMLRDGHIHDRQLVSMMEKKKIINSQNCYLHFSTGFFVTDVPMAMTILAA